MRFQIIVYDYLYDLNKVFYNQKLYKIQIYKLNIKIVFFNIINIIIKSLYKIVISNLKKISNQKKLNAFLAVIFL